MDDVAVSRFGPAALLVEFADKVDRESLARCRGLMGSFEENRLDGLVDVTPAYCSLLLEFDRPEHASNQVDRVAQLLKSARARPVEEAPLFEIPVCYDGPDLEEFARRNSLSVPNVIELHTAPVYSVFLIGFSPGFPYLGPLDVRLDSRIRVLACLLGRWQSAASTQEFTALLRRAGGGCSGGRTRKFFPQKKHSMTEVRRRSYFDKATR